VKKIFVGFFGHVGLHVIRHLPPLFPVGIAGGKKPAEAILPAGKIPVLMTEPHSDTASPAAVCFPTANG